jgi:hypothetical protein
MYGCAVDVTNSKEFGFDKVAGKCFVLKSNSGIGPSDSAGYLLLIAYSSNWSGSVAPPPTSVAEYDAAFATKNDSILAAGTRIIIDRITHILYSDSATYYVYGRIVSGPLKGRPVIITDFIGFKAFGEEIRTLIPDPECFEECYD